MLSAEGVGTGSCTNALIISVLSNVSNLVISSNRSKLLMNVRWVNGLMVVCVALGNKFSVVSTLLVIICEVTLCARLSYRLFRSPCRSNLARSVSSVLNMLTVSTTVSKCTAASTFDVTLVWLCGMYVTTPPRALLPSSLVLVLAIVTVTVNVEQLLSPIV